MKTSLIYSPFVRARKNFILPIRWWFKELRERSEMRIKSPKVIALKLKEEKDELLKAERIEDKRAIEVQKGRVNLLNWLIYGNSES